MRCWEGEHLNYSIVAILLIVIIFVTNMYIVMWKKPFRVSLYRFDPQFEGSLLFEALQYAVALALV